MKALYSTWSSDGFFDCGFFVGGRFIDGGVDFFDGFFGVRILGLFCYCLLVLSRVLLFLNQVVIR